MAKQPKNLYVEKDMSRKIVINEKEYYDACYLMNRDNSHRIVRTVQKQLVQNRWEEMDLILRSAYRIRK